MNLDSLISDANQFVGAYLIPFGWKLLGAIGVWIVTASKVMKLGTQTVSVGGGLRYWAESPDAGPHGWGAGAVVTLLFPKRARGSAAF